MTRAVKAVTTRNALVRVLTKQQTKEVKRLDAAIYKAHTKVGRLEFAVDDILLSAERMVRDSKALRKLIDKRLAEKILDRMEATIADAVRETMEAWRDDIEPHIGKKKPLPDPRKC
jgi:hypothetical protein